METITYFQVQALVEQLPEERLPAAYHMLRELVAQGDALQSQLEFLHLPPSQRRQVLARQAEALKAHYQQTAAERSEWQAGDFLDERPAR